jgi:hypothetical protein
MNGECLTMWEQAVMAESSKYYSGISLDRLKSYLI